LKSAFVAPLTVSAIESVFRIGDIAFLIGKEF